MKTSPPSITRRRENQGISRRSWLLLSAIALILLLVGYWTYDAVEETIHDHLTSVLHSTLQANIEALQIVVKNEQSHIQAWAKDLEVRVLTEQLIAGDNPEVLKQLIEVLANVIAEDGYLGFAIIDEQGVIRATDQPDTYLGKQLAPAAMELLAPVLDGKTSIEKPFAKNALIESDSEISSKPVLLAKAPIPDLDGRNIAALVFTIDPEKDFTRILSVAELGQTGSTYAFDNRGVMLSESRHEEQLKQLGLLPDTPESSAILTLELRDPGVDLTRGQAPDQPPQNWPLTRMAASAKSGAPGINIDGYRDYRGVKVVGAWRWLPEYGFGVATEVARDEALRSLRPVRLAFTGLLGLLVLTAGGFAVTGHFLNRLQKQIVELRELGQYTLVELIGAGGMGKVYKARHAMLRRPTAIKLIREEQLTEKTLERFEKEVQMTSQLTHPNTISVYDYGHSPDGVFYYAMEYLTGLTLGQLVKIETPIPPERVIYILLQIFGSLSEAHEQGLIHRDIKPGNVMLCQRGGSYDFVKVLDFGLVREVDTEQRPGPGNSQGIMGSPGFIAPELLVSDKMVDARSDIYSVGALGYLMLTGQLVFAGCGIREALRKTVNSDPPRPSENSGAEMPQALDDLIHACLARNADQRPASAAEAIAHLSAIDLSRGWTAKEACEWWQANAERVRLERKQNRPETGSLSETVLDIDFGERPGHDFST